MIATPAQQLAREYNWKQAQLKQASHNLIALYKEVGFTFSAQHIEEKLEFTSAELKREYQRKLKLLRGT